MKKKEKGTNGKHWICPLAFFAFILLSRFASFFCFYFAFMAVTGHGASHLFASGVKTRNRERRHSVEILRTAVTNSWVTPGITEEPEKPRKALITAQLLIQLLMLHSGWFDVSKSQGSEASSMVVRSKHVDIGCKVIVHGWLMIG